MVASSFSVRAYFSRLLGAIVSYRVDRRRVFAGSLARSSLLAVVLILASGSVVQAERLPFDVALPGRDYEQIADRDGVKVYQHRTAKIIRIAAEGHFSLSPQEVQEGLLDYEHQAGKIGRVSEVRVLSRGPAQLIVYQHLNLPWISDRDYVLRVRWGKSGVVRWIDFNAFGDPRLPPRDGLVRVKIHAGSWQIKPASNGKGSFARFQVLIDMGGLLPKWMARSGSGKEMPKMFRQIESFLRARHATIKNKPAKTAP